MTSARSNDVNFTISARDRASPVLQRVGQNVGRVQGSVVSMAGSLGTLSSATSGVLGPMGSLVTSMGVLGAAITGVGLGISLGINHLRGMREEAKKTAEATEGLRNRLLLSGFSADNAAASVDELRDSLSRTAFQALPALDFEMQGFIANLDLASKTRFGDLVDILEGLGISETAAVRAVAEAMQGNFTLINQLVPRSITSFEEFVQVMDDLKVKAVITETDVLGSLRRLTTGAELSAEDQATALLDLGRIFRDHGGEVEGILGALTDAELAEVLAFVEGKQNEAKELGIYEGLYGQNIDFILGHIQRAIGGQQTYTTAVRDEVNAAIIEWEKIDPAVADEIKKLQGAYLDGIIDLRTFERGIRVILDRAVGDYVSLGDTAVREAQRAVQATNMALAQIRVARANANNPPNNPFAGVINRIGSSSSPVLGPDSAPRAPVLPVPPLPSPLSSGGGARGGAVVQNITIPVHIGEETVDEIVVNVLNRQVSLREPGLGLG